MRAFLALAAAVMMQESGPAATNSLLPLRTNFVSGASLSNSDLESVVRLANVCGVERVTEVTTIRQLSGTTIEVNGDEKIQGRAVLFKRLQIRRDAWERTARPSSARSVGEFWVESVEPQQEERTIVEIGGRRERVGLLDGIRPAGADKIIDAFVKGRIRFGSEAMKDALSGMDVTRPTWIGIQQGNLWITFSSSNIRIVFALRENEVTLLDTVHIYE